MKIATVDDNDTHTENHAYPTNDELLLYIDFEKISQSCKIDAKWTKPLMLNNLYQHFEFSFF